MKAKTSPKEEARAAIEAALADLDKKEMTGLALAQIKALLNYAKTQIDLIQVLKRPRRAIPAA